MTITTLDARQERLVVGVALAFVGTLCMLGYHGVRMDDAYVTFRYAENVARGRGFVFNPGEHLLGTTSPGLALIAAALHALVGHDALPSVMSGLGAAAWTAQAGLLYAIVRPSLGARAAIVVAFGVAAGLAGSYFWVPMETNLVAALVLLSMLLAMRARWVGAGLVLGVAVVVRADAVLAGIPLLLLGARELRRGVMKPIAAFVPLPAAWGLFSFAYFGSIWPHTLHVKAFARSLGSYGLHLLKHPIHTVIPPLGDSIALAIGMWMLVIFGWWMAVARSPRLWVLPAWGLCHFAAYMFLRPDIAFIWHLYPLTLMCIVGALHGVACGLQWLAWKLAIVSIAVLGAAATWNALVFSVAYPHLFWFNTRDETDRQIATFLHDRAHEGDAVDAEEVATIAYYTDLRMLDHAGLVTPDELAVPHVSSKEHCRRMSELKGLRFLVLGRTVISAHRCMIGDQQRLYRFDLHATDGEDAWWVVDRNDAR